MRMLHCPRCEGVVVLESLECESCGLAVGLHPPSLTMVEATPDGVELDGHTWIPCSNRDWRCNWLVADDAGTAQCSACRLTRQRPESSDTIALEKLADAAVMKRRLLVQLADLGLPNRSLLRT